MERCLWGRLTDDSGERLNGIQEVSGSIPLISTKSPENHLFQVVFGTFSFLTFRIRDTKKKPITHLLPTEKPAAPRWDGRSFHQCHGAFFRSVFSLHPLSYHRMSFCAGVRSSPLMMGSRISCLEPLIMCPGSSGSGVPLASFTACL